MKQTLFLGREPLTVCIQNIGIKKEKKSLSDMIKNTISCLGVASRARPEQVNCMYEIEHWLP